MIMSHPLDEQNKLERRIQLEGNADPDHFKMPDGRTLTEVRQSNEKSQSEEYKKKAEAATELAREQSFESRDPIGKPVVNKTGTILSSGVEEKINSDNPKPANQPNTPTESSLPKTS